MTPSPHKSASHVHQSSQWMNNVERPARRSHRCHNSNNFDFQEQRTVLVAAVTCFVIYLFAISGLLCLMEQWDYFTAFYFLFNSVALIGFGDVFPSNARVVLFNCALIVFGIVLFGMCYFILQEEIRAKAQAASRRARQSFSRCRNAVQRNAARWAVNRRNSSVARLGLTSLVSSTASVHSHLFRHMNHHLVVVTKMDNSTQAFNTNELNDATIQVAFYGVWDWSQIQPHGHGYRGNKRIIPRRRSAPSLASIRKKTECTVRSAQMDKKDAQQKLF